MLTLRTAAAALLLSVGLFVVISCGDKGSDADPAAEETPAPAAARDVPFKELDFEALPDDFTEAIAVVRQSQTWATRERAMRSGAEAGVDPRKSLELKMDREVLGQAYDAGSAFLVNWQLPEGNFRYMYDWQDGTWVDDDHQVRQAGSLWGIATCYRHKPTAEAKEALDKGLRFWFEHTIPGPDEGTLMMKYPGDNRLDSGTVALVSLAIIEYLKTDAPMDDAWRTELDTKLDGYLGFLVWMQRDNGHISKSYDHKRKKRRESSNGYYDGESLLAMSKAARQLGKTELVPTIERAARAMAETYTVKAWAKSRDSNETKGFFQWGCMSFAEYYQAGWADKELIGDVALSLGFWMIHTHRTLSRRRNHAYAVEGLLAAWRIANMRGDIPAQTDLLFVADRSLYKLSQWQIGGPLAGENKWLRDNNTDDPMAQGGVMNAKKPSGRPVAKDVAHQLRIDVTQHQMHAVTMSLEHVYGKE